MTRVEYGAPDVAPPGAATGTIGAPEGGLQPLGYNKTDVYGQGPISQRIIAVDAITAVNATSLGLQAGDVLTAKGRTVAGDVDFGFPFLVVGSGTANGGTMFSIGGGLFAALMYSGNPQVAWWGAVGDGVADDTESIQAAINSVTSTTRVTRLQCSTGCVYGVSNIGTVPGPGRQLALQLKVGVILDLNGSTIKRLGSTITYDLIRGEGSGTFPSIAQTMGVVNGTLDGSTPSLSGTPADRGFNIWLIRVKDPVIENVHSKDSPIWGVRLDQCRGGAFVNNIKSTNGAVINGDGIHFVDCREITGSGFEVYTQGDDGFIVEAQRFDVFGMNLTGIVTQTPMAVAAAGRGVLVFRETLGGTITNPVQIRDNHIQAICLDAGGSGRSGWGLNVDAEENCTVVNNVFDVVAENCDAALYVDTHSTAVVRNNTFNVNSYKCKTPAASVADIVVAGHGTVEGNTLNGTVFDSPVGGGGAYLLGSRWGGRLSVDYNLGAKGASLAGVDLIGQNNTMTVDAKGYTTSLRVRQSGCTIYLGSLTGSTTAAIDLAGPAAGTIFVGGNVSGAVTGSTNATRFIGTAGVLRAQLLSEPLTAGQEVDILGANNRISLRGTGGQVMLESNRLAGTADYPAFSTASGGVITYEGKGASANIGIRYNVKGTSQHIFGATGETEAHLRVGGAAAPGGGLQVLGTASVVTLTASSLGSANYSAYLSPTGTGSVRLRNSAGASIVWVDSTGLGFFSKTPVAQPTSASVTDYASLKVALQNLGLIGT